MISTAKKTDAEVQRIGLDVLRRELGVLGMVRFLQQFERGQGDYSEDRGQWQDGLTVAHLADRIIDARGAKGSNRE